MIKTIFTNDTVFVRSLVPKMGQESCSKGCDSGRKPTMRDSGRVSAMFAVVTCYSCNKTAHQKKD